MESFTEFETKSFNFTELAQIVNKLNNRENFASFSTEITKADINIPELEQYPNLREYFLAVWPEIDRFFDSLSNILTLYMSDSVREENLRQLLAVNSTIIKNIEYLFYLRELVLSIEYEENFNKLESHVNLNKPMFASPEEYARVFLMQDYNAMKPEAQQITDKNWLKNEKFENLTDFGKQELEKLNAKLEEDKNIIPRDIEKDLMNAGVVIAIPYIANLFNLLKLYSNDPTLSTTQSREDIMASSQR